ncbi:hypothetical protein ACWGI0_25985 [Streptomyces sp. NPDC054802]
MMEEVLRPYRVRAAEGIGSRVLQGVQPTGGVLGLAGVRAGDFIGSALGARFSEGLAARVLGPDPFGLRRSLGATGILGSSGLQLWGLTAAGRYNSALEAAGVGRGRSQLFAEVLPATSFMPRPAWAGELFTALDRPLAPRLPEQAEDLAEELFPPNLQGFSDKEWARLIDLCDRDGIGVMWAPGPEHLRALLAAESRKERYAYLVAHQEEILDELDAGIDEVAHRDLADLAGLTRATVRCARSGGWDGALALAGNVLNTAMEHHGVAWYRTRFATVPQINGVHGPGAVLRFVDRNVPLPERTVGIFDLAAHLVLRSIREVFADTRTGVTTQETFNRHLAAHRSSYDSYRQEFTVPALLGAHTLLRALDEAKAQPGGD